MRGRRAFTVLEIVLAAAIGSIVVATSLAMLASLDRTDARLDVRHRQRMELARTRTAIQRVMTSLVMDDSKPVEDDDPNRPARRLDLRPLDSPGAQRLFGLARLTGNDLGSPQSFEVVAGRPPRAAGSLLARRIAPETIGDDEPENDEAALDAAERPTHRGVFELWPDGTAPRTPEAERAWPSAEGMTLWWIPLGVPGPDGAPGAPLAGAVPLAGGLVACQWRVLYRGERQTTYDATWVVDLPGYVEFEATTNMGVHVNWMFEIMWTEGPEDEVVAPDGDEEGGAGGRDATGNADGTGAGVEGRAPTVPQNRGGGGSSRRGGSSR